jgi:hypothetical protein
MSKLGDGLVKQTKSTTIITKETEINPVTGNTKEVVVSSQFLDVMINKNRRQNKDGTIILRIEPKLKSKFNKKCKKMNYKMSEVIVAFINEYVGQE